MASSSSLSTFQDPLTAYAVSWEPSDDDDDWTGESEKPPTIERTIRNLTDGSLTVTFVPEQGIVWCEDLFADPNNWEKKVLERFIGPQAQIAFWIDGNSAKEICGKLIFHDRNDVTHEREYRKDVHHIAIYLTSADRNPPNPDIDDSDREDDQEDEINTNPYINPKPYPTNFARGSDKEDKRGTIVVVGRYGSGKSTLLNALAGVHWSFVDGQFVAHPAETELFHSAGRVVEPVTLNGQGTTIDTFDGRTINVIDTPSYKDRFNTEQFDNRYILTDTLRELDEISALVIVMNYRDPHVTHGFVESLVGVPRSFKQRQMNVILVFTNCSGKDLAVNPGQAVIVRRALGFESGDPEFPIFYLDKWKFQSLTDDARHTITNLTKFLDLVSDMPKLSCMEFEQMRTLSEFERTMRRRIQAYFQQSENEERESPGRSGFENTLYSWALQYQDNNQNFVSAVEFAEGLCANLQKRIVQDLPEEIRLFTGNVGALELQCFKFKVAPPAERHSAAKFVMGAVGRFIARFAAVAMVIVGCHANFGKASVIRAIVVRISHNNAPALSQAIVAQFTDHVDRESEKIVKMYRS